MEDCLKIFATLLHNLGLMLQYKFFKWQAQAYIGLPDEAEIILEKNDSSSGDDIKRLKA